MPEVQDFNYHPIFDNLEADISRIVFMLARHQWNTKALYVGQEIIIDDLLRIEAAEREHKQKGKDLRRQAASLAIEAKSQPAGITDAVRCQTARLYEEANEYDEARRVLQFGTWLYRYFGDGIAWHAYGYNRRLISALASKQPIGFLLTNDDFKPMHRLFRAIRHQGREWLPLLHDITNCLRTADLSVFHNGVLNRVIEFKIQKCTRGADDQGTPSLKPLDDRAHRQQERLKGVRRYMVTKDMADLDPRYSGGRAIDSDTMERHNFEAISSAIAQARLEGCGFSAPEKPLLYLSWDIKRSNQTETLRSASQRFPYIFINGITFRDVSARPGLRPGGLPLTAMTLPPGDILDILFGRFAVIILINLNLLENACTERGVPLRVVHQPNGGFSLEQDVGGFPGEVREGLWDRLLSEALSVESFVGLLQSIMTNYKPPDPNTSA